MRKGERFNDIDNSIDNNDQGYINSSYNNDNNNNNNDDDNNS